MSATTPAVGASNVPLDTTISCEVHIPNGGIDADTLTPATVYLTRTNGTEHIPAALNTTGGGDAIILRPLAKLLAKTQYTFVVTAGLKDVTGASFAPFQMTFRTGTASAITIDKAFKGVKFNRVDMPDTAVARFLGITMGPDHKVYAGTDDGRIFRFPINPDETLGTPDIITTIRDANHGPRFVVGLAFDPASTADNPILWVSHTAAGVIGAPDWTGTISRLDGPDLGTIRDVVVHLPRSYRDHVTGQLAFGPDGALYFGQPSNTAMGAPDVTWGRRPEHVLNAAILRLDVSKVDQLTAPIDARTPDGGGTYNPFARNAPLTIYATGVRNAYDILWHSNGQLYAPVNGSAAGGSSPGSPDGKVPALDNISVPAFDVMFRILPDRYYGHPNPQRNEYVLLGGNPTPGADPFEVPDYPVGTAPPLNWRSGIYNFGLHESPDGLIEYKSGSFGGALKNDILVAEYSANDDIVVLQPSSDKLGIFKGQAGIPSLSNFRDPLDMTEDLGTGNLYVVEYDASARTGKITLLQVPQDQRDPAGYPAPPAPDPQPTPTPEPTPTPAPDPTPVPVQQDPPPIRTARELKLIVKIQHFASARGLPQPDVTYTPGAQLKGIFSDLRVKAAIVGYAAKKSLPVPDLTQAAGLQLKGIYSDMKVKAKIVSYATRKKLAVPDLSQASGAQLTAIYNGLKQEAKRQSFAARVAALAAKKKYPVPDLSGMTLDQLTVLYATIRHSVA